MEYKAIPIQDSLQIANERTVKSIFAVTGNVDRVGDIIQRGAFAKTIADRFQSGVSDGHIKVLWQHNSDEPPIGTLSVLKEVGKSDLPATVRAAYPEATGGLYGEWDALDTPRGNEVLAGIKGGAITQNSIGFDIVKWDMGDAELDGQKSVPVRYLKDVRLWDVSPVNWGANPATANVKALDYRVERITALVESLYDEMKAGRMFSQANVDRMRAMHGDITDTHQKLRAIADDLHGMLSAAEPPNADDTAKALTAQLLQRLRLAELEYISI